VDLHPERLACPSQGGGKLVVGLRWRGPLLTSKEIRMSSGVTILAIVLAGSMAVFVLLPILESRSQSESMRVARRGSARQKQTLETLEAEKMRVLRAIRDLDFDYDLDKLTVSTYTTQRIHLIQLAAAITQRIDELEAEIAQQQERIEEAVATLRRKQASR
jgi:hypothetical protein